MAFKKEKTKVKAINNHMINAISPMALEFNPSDLWFGEQLAKVILIIDYPPEVKVGWLSSIANMEGVTCSIHIAPTNPAKLIEHISKSMGEIFSKLDKGGSPYMMKRFEQQYKDADKLLDKIDKDKENVFYVNVSILITAKDKEELQRKSIKIESSIAGMRMKGRVAMFQQEQSLLAVSPYSICPQAIQDVANRNMPVSSIAASFPFNSSGLNDGEGYVFGKDKAGGIILFNPWLRGGDRTNSNWTILGAPGVGKSATVKHIFLNEYSQGTKIIIIDPEREYKDLCENLNGQWINCGGGKGGRINPLQVKETPKDDEENDKLYKDEGKGMGSLALHFQTLRTFFRLYLKDLNDMDYATLEEVLEELYHLRGITWQTDTSKVKNEQYPTLEDLYNLMNSKVQEDGGLHQKKERYEKLALLLRRSAVGADAALWNGITTITAEADFIVLDTHDLQEADDVIKRTQYFNILTWAWQQLSKDREEKILLGVDEAYLIVDPEVPQALQFLRNVSKRIRKYEGGLVVITHSVVDFLDPSIRRHGQALMDNPCFKFFMGTDGKNLEELTNLMHLTEAEQELLAKKARGEGLLIAGSKRIHGIVELAEHEIEAFGKGGGK